jgi:hypothetical protein
MTVLEPKKVTCLVDAAINYIFDHGTLKCLYNLVL